jgi:hypothetical protein
MHNCVPESVVGEEEVIVVVVVVVVVVRAHISVQCFPFEVSFVY